MPVRFENFDYSFKLGGKPVFKPSDFGRKIGYDIKAQVEEAYQFDPFVFHFLPGGHVAALHAHRQRKFFARIDIERFFYGIGRSRVMHALRAIGLARSEHYAKWSTVKNPYGDPSYALPYGFVQSPILASLALMTSPVGNYLRGLPDDILKSVYMDDIALSGNDLDALTVAFNGLVAVLADSGFQINGDKTRPPAAAMDVFNCDLSFGEAVVREDRKIEFYEIDRSGASASAFERYCAAVENGNVAAEPA
ncbi:hypothetical protein EN742_05920 [Mesorhizobium sp. M4A.F.Ca.ET.020.02.1.1]|uniref:reverse transcriptase domain-containing protein n=1 Tax=unclassified Mesorhizobium TaxID=325217 RepID=UPI000FD39214|nr:MULTISPECIES: reverse transcriptase domain-containing protein [unclassified Mesorhizobium]RVD43115.1 hypothetical protein EN742_05920 [Mesorhizobium sp. M4A.F.Ca.ET.020.02.1.1]RWC20880.1 MAG: hypothetical protein EOS53_07970 [Mesorhizobium sp.]TIX62506.1 MAG: hypothetical protein E5V33_15070 [Mesorhizobium sp.]